MAAAISALSLTTAAAGVAAAFGSTVCPPAARKDERAAPASVTVLVNILRVLKSNDSTID